MLHFIRHASVLAGSTAKLNRETGTQSDDSGFILCSHTFMHIFILCRALSTMRVLCLAAILASACAFTSHSAAFTPNSPLVGERQIDNAFSSSGAHRNRKSTIVMDGKANGKFLRNFCTSATHTYAASFSLPHEMSC